MNDRAGKNRARPNRAGSANFTEGSAEPARPSLRLKVAKVGMILTKFWYFFSSKKRLLFMIYLHMVMHLLHNIRKQYNQALLFLLVLNFRQNDYFSSNRGSAKFAEDSAEPARPKMANGSAEPARFGRSLTYIIVYASLFYFYLFIYLFSEGHIHTSK